MLLAKNRKSLTVRLQDEEYAAAKRVATKRKMSLNSVVEEGIRMRLAKEEYDELYEAFGQVGLEDDCDVEFAFHAQAEVVLRDD